ARDGGVALALAPAADPWAVAPGDRVGSGVQAGVAASAGAADRAGPQFAAVRAIDQALGAVDEAGLDRSRVLLLGAADPIAARDETGALRTGIDERALDALLALGTALCFDDLGRIPNVRTVVSDHDVAMTILRCAELGAADRILLSCGIRNKHRLAAYGGNGFEFLTEQFAPYLRMLGAGDALVSAVLHGNALRLLTRRAPGGDTGREADGAAGSGAETGVRDRAAPAAPGSHAASAAADREAPAAGGLASEAAEPATAIPDSDPAPIPNAGNLSTAPALAASTGPAASIRSAAAIPNLEDLEIPNLEGLVQTVLGPVRPEALGPTLMHEHLFLDIRRPAHSANPRRGEWDPAAQAPLSLGTLAAVRRGRPCADNDILGDFDEMVDEVADFARQGGGAMVEVTPSGVGRDPLALAGLSRASGLHLVMGCGWYQKDLHPAGFAERSLDELTAEIVRDIVAGAAIGADGARIRAGIIGEAGAEGDPVDPQEMRSVRAAGRASALTGAPITLHMGGFGEAKLRVLDALEEEGADPRSVIFGHAGTIADDMGLARRLLARGVSVEADFLGTTGSPWGTLFPFTDRDAARGFAELVADGWGGQLVLGGDVCQRVQLRRWGGHGYGYIVEHFLPTLAEFGVDEAALRSIMVENPARLLAFRAPQPRSPQPPQSRG
ncbi:MAG: hypothetical protein QM606_03180, partial [Leucobacter sp.]